MKNILAENMLRFGVKNLNETDKAILSEALLLEQVQLVDNAVKTLNEEAAKYLCQVSQLTVKPELTVAYTDFPYKKGDEFQQGVNGINYGYNTITQGFISGTDTKQQSGPGSQPTHIYKIDPTNTLTSPPRSLWAKAKITKGDSPLKDYMTRQTTVYGLYDISEVYTDYGNTAQGLKDKLKSFYGKFYNANKQFNNDKQLDMYSPLTDTVKFDALISTLVDELAKLRILVKHTGLYGTGGVDPIAIFKG